MRYKCQLFWTANVGVRGWGWGTPSFNVIYIYGAALKKQYIFRAHLALKVGVQKLTFVSGEVRLKLNVVVINKGNLKGRVVGPEEWPGSK